MEDSPVLVGDEERSPDIASIRVLALLVENLLVVLVVVEIHGSVESQDDHLRDLQTRQTLG